MTKYQLQELHVKGMVNDKDIYYHAMKMTDEQVDFMNANHFYLRDGK